MSYIQYLLMPEQIVVTAAPIVHVSDFLSPSDGFNLWERVVSSLGIVECLLVRQVLGTPTWLAVAEPLEPATAAPLEMVWDASVQLQVPVCS